MTFDIDSIKKEIQSEGVCVVPGVFSSNICQQYISSLENIVNQNAQTGAYFGSNNVQVVYNYFLYDKALLEILQSDLIFDVMTSLIGKEFVLISPVARNPRVRGDLPEGEKTAGIGWHVDSRTITSEVLELHQPSLMYYAAIALEPFTLENAATQYIPKSHLRYQRPADRNADLSCSVLEAGVGSIVFFDSALWHRSGEPTQTSRWSLFNAFGPWYMKPYFRFWENYSPDELRALPDRIQQLFHLRCMPPRNESEGTVTVTKDFSYERIAKKARWTSDCV
jgi:hypothetical protein